MSSPNLIYLRPHHLLCSAKFIGHGYSPAFTKHMTEIVKRFRTEPDLQIGLVNGPDELCSCCPNLLVSGKCISQSKVEMFDAAVLKRYHLSTGIHSYRRLEEVLIGQMNAATFEELCGSCEWYSLCKDIPMHRF